MENETVSEESTKRETTSLDIELNNNNTNENEIDTSDLDLKLVSEYFKYLEQVGNDPKMYADKKAAEGLKNIFSICTRQRSYIISEKSYEFNFVTVLINLLKNTYEEFLSILKSDKLMKGNNYTIVSLKYALCVSRSFSNYSLKFCNNFHNQLGISYIFNYLNDESILDSYIKSAEKPKSFRFLLLHSIVNCCLGTLLNLSRVIDVSNYKQQWNDCKAVESLFAYSEKVAEISDNRISSYICLANILDDTQIDHFQNLQQVIPEIVKLIKLCADKIKSKEVLKRLAIQLDENSEEIKDICCVNHKNTIWHLVELINALYHLAINDSIKYDIYEKHLMKEHLRTIIYKGNDTELEYALKLLNQLCFDQRVSNDILEDKKLYKHLKNLKDSTSDFGYYSSKNVQQKCEGILFIISNKNKKVNNHNQSISNDNDNLKQIMISYNRESRDVILRIKQELENLQVGFKIWIDVEDIHGSSLESMAKAIEQSQCVIIGMSEFYKQSTNCRAEAEYAFQLNKKIVPLILQKDYKPDGWLGIILGSKIFVNFTKYTFEECMRRLKQEIISFEEHDKENKPVEVEINKNPNIIKSNEIVNWSEYQVENWLLEKKMNKLIHENVSPCDGKILFQLYEMMNTAPEFFYSSITSNKEVPTREVASFSYELKLLFKNQK